MSKKTKSKRKSKSKRNKSKVDVDLVAESAVPDMESEKIANAKIETLAETIAELKTALAWQKQRTNQLSHTIEELQRPVDDDMTPIYHEDAVDPPQEPQSELDSVPPGGSVTPNSLDRGSADPPQGPFGWLNKVNEYAQWFVLLGSLTIGLWRLNAMDRRLENSSMMNVYGHSLKISEIGMHYPDVHMMYLGSVYDTNKGEKLDEFEQTKLDIYCEMQLDFFEVVLMEIDTVDAVDQEFWRKYISNEFKRSKAVSDFLIGNQDFYSPTLLGMCRRHR